MLGSEGITTGPMLLGLLSGWGVWTYLGLAVLVALEGPVVTLLGAMIASTGSLSPLEVFAAAALGNLTADVLWYTVGYLGKLDWLRQHGHWLGLHENQLNRLESIVQAHAPRLLFISKLTLGFMIPALITTGLARIPWRRWLLPLVAAETLWTGTLVLLGYYFGSSIRQLEWGVQVLAVGSAILLLFLLARYWTQHRPDLNNPAR